MLVKIMSDYGLREIFKEDFEQLHLKFFQLDRMIEVIVQIGRASCRERV